LELPGLRNLDSYSKELLQHKFQEILDRPTGTSKSRGMHLDMLEFKVKHLDNKKGNQLDLPVD
jgi:hypothetical protein